MPDAKAEIMGWRDERISEWHRTLGYGFPAVGIEFLLVEYTHGIPVALIDYKHENAGQVDRKHPSYRALLRLCASASLPLLVVFYSEDLTRFIVEPLNDLARTLVSHRTTMPEANFKNLLSAARKRAALKYRRRMV